MFRSAATALALIVLPSLAAAQDVHQVAQGETLWALARRYYEAPTRWPEIYEANRAVIQDPHWIFPGQQIVIPGINTSQTAARPLAPAPARDEAAPPAPVTRPAPVERAATPDAPDTVAPARTPDHISEASEPPEREPDPPVDVRTDSTARPGPAVAEPEPVPPRASDVRRTERASSSDADYGVRPGDQVETRFFTAGGDEVASVQGNRVVDRDGNVFFPYVGTVHVEGLDAVEIRELLLDRFETFYRNPVVTANVKLKVNITGVVGSPSHYLFDPTTTLMDALAAAGGTGLEFTIANNAAADLENVRLVRDGEAMLIDVRPESADPAVLAMPVQSGDWIHVPPKARSRIRDDLTFWSGVVSLATSAAAVVVLLAR